jgi:hypothetical protein
MAATENWLTYALLRNGTDLVVPGVPLSCVFAQQERMSHVRQTCLYDWLYQNLISTQVPLLYLAAACGGMQCTSMHSP